MKSDPSKTPELDVVRKYNISNKGKRLDSKETIIGVGEELKQDRAFKTDEVELLDDISIDDDVRSGHLGCFGTTRIGKTKLIENLVCQDIAKGYNVVVIDPKGDTELYCRIIQTCVEYGRLDDLMMLTPIYPECSARLNPLSHWFMQDELVDHVVSGIKAKEDYYIGVATSVTQAVVEGMIRSAMNNTKTIPFFNFNDIRKRIDHASLEGLRNTISNIAGTEARELEGELNQILSAPPDFFAKVCSSLLTTLRSLTTGNIGTIIGKTYSNEFINRIQQGRGVVLFCNTGSLLARRSAHIVGKVIVSCIQSLVGRWLARGAKLNPPLAVHIDEAHNVMYRGIQELFNKCGGGNVWVHIYTQSIAQIIDEIGQEGAISILDNINTWVYMRVNHPETGKYIEDVTPPVRSYEPMYRFGAGLVLRSENVPMILSQQLLALPKRHFFLRTSGRFYHGITKTVSQPWVKISYPEIDQKLLAALPEMIDMASGKEMKSNTDIILEQFGGDNLLSEGSEVEWV